MLTALLAGESIPEGPFVVCSTCGNTALGRQDQPCAVCKAGPEGFIEIS